VYGELVVVVVVDIVKLNHSFNRCIKEIIIYTHSHFSVFRNGVLMSCCIFHILTFFSGHYCRG